MRQLFAWLFVVLFPGSLCAQMALENPTPGQTLTGVGLLSGWACEAQNMTVQFNDTGPHVPILGGSPRADTRPTCGHDDTGFALLVNWNNLEDGEHSLTVFVGGQPVSSREFQVVTYGEEFLSGIEKTWWIADWPESGTDTKIAWSEAKQNIEIANIEAAELPDYSGVSVRDFRGRWSIDCDKCGYDFQLYLDTVRQEGNVQTLVGRTGDHPTAPHGYRVYVEKNTFRFFGEPLRQFGIHWIDSGSCHYFAFDLVSPDLAEGYYWYGYGVEWDECRQDAFGTFPARAEKRR